MTQEAMKLALDALDIAQGLLADARSYHQPKMLAAYTAIKQALAQPEQEPVAWPCLIDSADFSENTITLVMQCEDYKVSAGTHYLSTIPPKETK
jgi:hypothetical protein